MNQKHTDIQYHGIIAKLPEKWRHYAYLARFDRPVGIWLLFIPCLFGLFLADRASLSLRLYDCALFFLGSILMRSAGCVINDIWDRDLDAQVSRTAKRPLACGALSLKQAFSFLVILLLLSLIILIQLPINCWILAPFALILVALYPLAKRYTWWPQLVMGFTFGFGAPMGYVAACGSIKFSDLLNLKLFTPCLLLYGGVILWQLGFDTIYGFQDIEDDARIGVKSSSQKVLSYPKFFIGFCYISALTLFDASAQTAHLTILFLIGLLPATWLLIRQAMHLEPLNPPKCLKDFQYNIFIGLLLSLGYILGRL